MASRVARAASARESSGKGKGRYVVGGTHHLALALAMCFFCIVGLLVTWNQRVVASTKRLSEVCKGVDFEEVETRLGGRLHARTAHVHCRPCALLGNEDKQSCGSMRPQLITGAGFKH